MRLKSEIWLFSQNIIIKKYWTLFLFFVSDPNPLPSETGTNSAHHFSISLFFPYQINVDCISVNPLQCLMFTIFTSITTGNFFFSDTFLVTVYELYFVDCTLNDAYLLFLWRCGSMCMVCMQAYEASLHCADEVCNSFCWM